MAYNINMKTSLNIKKIKALMEKSGIGSISQLAEMSGIHRNTIRSYLNGTNSPYSSSFVSISKCLNSTPDELVERQSTNPIGQLLELIHPVIVSNPNLAFILIGSRARGNSRRYSDIDIGLSSGTTPLDYKKFLSIKSEIEDLVDDFAWLVDIVNLDEAPRWFLESIDYEPRLLAGNSLSYFYVMGLIHGTRKETNASVAERNKVKSHPRKKAA